MLMALAMLTGCAHEAEKSGGEIATVQEPYRVSWEDRMALSQLPEPDNGGQWVRCRDNNCYVMMTGEQIGEAKDGLYLVW